MGKKNPHLRAQISWATSMSHYGGNPSRKRCNIYNKPPVSVNSFLKKIQLEFLDKIDTPLLFPRPCVQTDENIAHAGRLMAHSVIRRNGTNPRQESRCRAFPGARGVGLPRRLLGQRRDGPCA